MADVLIVGGGIVGLLSALELADRGREVVLVDAPSLHPPASWAGGGILSPLYHWRYPEPMNRLTLDGPRRYRALVRRLAGPALAAADLNESGLWVEAAGEEAERGLAWAQDHGQRCQVAPLSAHLPAGRAGEGLWFPDVGNIRNPRMLKGLRDGLAALGVTRVEARVTEVTPTARGGEVILDNGERLAAPTVLISAGAWSASLLAPLGVSLPLFPAKGEMLLYRLPPGQVRATILTEQGYLIPRSDGAVLAGSTLTQGDASTSPTAPARRRLETMAVNILPMLADCQPARHWAGVRPGAARDWPWLGPVPGTDGIFAAVGHHRNGLVSAPASAELLAQLMCGETPFVDPADYSLESSSPSS
ncbi:NAD(P)/FAD-dependent oxidoreductase [Alloalcanivorax gelatiniphagus]|uniref:FAD-dependent oxidoreductase n=1 Tax=Alloalcanivorax gelatiniphagus TaxID=1194167 RepID=A0ABY2XQF6_9GAMM|nr:FAD-dependent oxidoreductase [Alloalcanivorax gelatiniphagus]TMW14998.1 FAD-dependent oxidoreductase [Alloalcanivorax gelatiniphagus]